MPSCCLWEALRHPLRTYHPQEVLAWMGILVLTITVITTFPVPYTPISTLVNLRYVHSSLVDHERC